MKSLLSFASRFIPSKTPQLMSNIKTKKPVMATAVLPGNAKEDFEIITIKEAAQRLNTTPQSVEYLITNNNNGEGTTLDFTFPFQHDGEKSGPKCIICNEKYFNQLALKKK